MTIKRYPETIKNITTIVSILMEEFTKFSSAHGHEKDIGCLALAIVILANNYPTLFDHDESFQRALIMLRDIVEKSHQLAKIEKLENEIDNLCN